MKITNNFKKYLLVFVFVLAFTSCSKDSNITPTEATTSQNPSVNDKSIISMYIGEDENFKAIYIEYYHILDFKNNDLPNMNFGKFYLINKGQSNYNTLELELIGDKRTYGFKEDSIDFKPNDMYVKDNLRLQSTWAEDDTLSLKINGDLIFKLENIENLFNNIKAEPVK